MPGFYHRDVLTVAGECGGFVFPPNRLDYSIQLWVRILARILEKCESKNLFSLLAFSRK